jgi:hypothetical protein
MFFFSFSQERAPNPLVQIKLAPKEHVCVLVCVNHPQDSLLQYDTTRNPYGEKCRHAGGVQYV